MNEHETNPAAITAGSDWGSRGHVRTLVLLAATGLGIYLCYLLTLPFLAALTWALTFAVVLSPFQRRIEAIVKRPTLAALIVVLVISVIVLGVVMFVGQRLVQEAANGAALIKTKVASGEWRHALEAHPRLAPLADWMERQNLPETLKTVATWMTTTGAAFVKGSIIEVLELLLTFYLLFFFLRDRRAALLSLRSLSPLSEGEMDRLFEQVGNTIFATVNGTLAVAGMQGLLGGLMFWWLGLPVPLLWGVVMALLAMVPVLGAFVVWIPAALYLAIDGCWGKALILVVWGMFIVSTIDNLLRPILMGTRLKLHTVFAFISVVGGLLVFGSSGLILGPVIYSVTTELLKIWRQRTAAEAAATAVAGHPQ